jgi:hypothetical protein
MEDTKRKGEETLMDCLKEHCMRSEFDEYFYFYKQ